MHSCYHDDHSIVFFVKAGGQQRKAPDECFEKGIPASSSGACFQFSPNIQNLPWYKWLHTPGQSCTPSTGARPRFAETSPSDVWPTHTPCLSFHCHFKQNIEAHALSPFSFADQHRLVWALLTRPFILSGHHQQGPAGQHRILDLDPLPFVAHSTTNSTPLSLNPRVVRHFSNSSEVLFKSLFLVAGPYFESFTSPPPSRSRRSLFAIDPLHSFSCSKFRRLFFSI